MSFNGYKKGVNLGGWLSQCCHTKEHYDTFINETDIGKIAAWGADHVRLPVDYNLVENNDGSEKESGYSYIDKAVDWCRKNGLNLVLDLHKTAGFSFDKGENEKGFFESDELQQRFCLLWERLSKRYASSDGSIAFELLNEVTEQSYAAIWNNIIRRCIGGIRRHAPENLILVGGYWQNSPDAVADLEPPYDDNVIYNFHCYDPMKFTHQGAYWVEGMDTGFRMDFESCGLTPGYFIKRFEPAVTAAKKNGTVLYCGEYGVIDNASPEDTLKWYKTINAAFEELGISRAAWSYKQMDFGLSDDRMKGVISEIVKYL